MNNGDSGRTYCQCEEKSHCTKFVVITGGPGGGKTAVLEMARRSFCKHTAILPEAASILFKGGFWRHETTPGKEAAQRAIYHIQREQERLVAEETQSGVVLCDRGTLDSLAYWPGPEKSYFADLGTSMEAELARYAVVIHLKTPPMEQGYNHENPLRIETATQAAEIDEKILAIWARHPNHHIVESTTHFLEKAKQVIDLIYCELPECCKKYRGVGNQSWRSF